MQTTPALPWDYNTEGGVIQLSEAVTKWDLIAGKIIPIFEVNERKVTGQFVEYPSDNKIYVELSSGLVYRLPIDEYPTNTLRLERTNEFPQSGTELIEVDVSTEDVPNLLTKPSLPYGGNVQILLKDALSFDELPQHLEVYVNSKVCTPIINEGGNLEFRNGDGGLLILAYEGELNSIQSSVQGPGGLTKLTSIVYNE